MLLSVFIATASFGKDLKIAVGLSLPPYVIKNQDKGMELDIVRNILKEKGHNPQFVFVPFGEVYKKLVAGEVDAALTLQSQLGGSVHYSDDYIQYQNVAVTLENKGIKISSLADLSKASIGSFQNAKIYLGAEFKKVVEANENYREFPVQVRQVRALFTQGIDVFVGDLNIFKYYRKNAGRASNTKQAVSVHEIFPRTNYQMGFKDKSIRDAFNAGLKEMKASGAYQAKINEYTK